MPAVTPDRIEDPTGVGDAFRGGFMKGLAMGVPFPVCAQLGSVAATYALEHLGGTSHAYTWNEFIGALRTALWPLAGDNHMIRFAMLAAATTLAVTMGAALHGAGAAEDHQRRRLHGARRPIAARRCSARSAARCHDPARFTGDAFFDAFDGKALKELWDIASGTMPEDNPGSLKPQEYGDIIAYFLQLNAFPTGDAELPGNAGAMANIKVEKPKK